MTANELMIGNYVYYNVTNRPSNNVVKIDGSDINVMSFKKEYLESHRPISLNQDWLERAGAIKSNYRNKWFIDDVVIPEWIKYVHNYRIGTTGSL